MTIMIKYTKSKMANRRGIWIGNKNDFYRDIEARLSLTKLIAALGSVTGKLRVYVWL